MNAYVVRTKDRRDYVEPVMDDGSGPSFEYQPIAPVVAETAGQAKNLFLREFAHRHGRNGVETDDYPNLRVRLLERDYDAPAGVVEESAHLWMRIHEVEDHGGAICDCPEEPL